MKKKLLTLTFTVSFITIFVGSVYNNAHTDPTGAPSSRTGSPGDGGNTCALSGCHAGNTVTTKSNIISSDIPIDGYTPGVKYTITATSTSSPNRNIFGLQISPQSSTGVKRGTMALINASETQMTGGSKYLTHTQLGITGSGGQKTWSFFWTAPTAGTGAVTFYGCFNNANGDGSANGDSIIKTTYTVQEKIAIGINKDELASIGISIFPNPVYHHIYIKNENNIKFDRVEIIDLTGKVIYQSEGMVDVDLQLEKTGVAAGVYFIKLYNENVLLGATKFIKQ
ncbi:MAG: T9SS type A sorting domain-containing protein [Sphingobacteriales bacterium]|nr:T9SS type A sorting domain-containing protein [Sphingobacteriales bacterium]